MITLTKEQKKIIYIALVSVVSLFLFLFLIYLPQSRLSGEIKGKLIAAEAEIADINRIAQGRSMEEALQDLNSQFKQFSNKLPTGEEDVLAVFSEEAKKLKIDVLNIEPGEEKILEGKVPGFAIKEFPVTLKLSGEFKSIGDYLHILRNSLPILAQVNQVNIQGAGEGNLKLTLDLKVAAFLSETAGK